MDNALMIEVLFWSLPGMAAVIAYLIWVRRQDRKMKLVTTDSIGFNLKPPHWFEYRCIALYPASDARRPETFREWFRCAYNADVFIGRIPFLKVVAVVSWTIAWAVAR